jgi:hypothetical protein
MVIHPCYVMSVEDLPQNIRYCLDAVCRGSGELMHVVGSYVSDVDACEEVGDDTYGEGAKEEECYICSKILDEWLTNMGVCEDNVVFFSIGAYLDSIPSEAISPIKVAH